MTLLEVAATLAAFMAACAATGWFLSGDTSTSTPKVAHTQTAEGDHLHAFGVVRKL